jgi:hypothetical protein
MNRPDAGLPEVYDRILPELAGLSWSSEPLADCANCAMRTNPHPQFPKDYLFTSPANCCTYHPELPNFLAGRALRRADAGSVRVLKRMSTPGGVVPYGILPHRYHQDFFAKMHGDNPDDWFGRAKVVCPFWVGGERPCSIYQDRTSICRTWFCKFEQGTRGFRSWRRLQAVLSAVEHALGEWCARVGQPPKPGAPRQEWVEFFLWSARRVDAMTDADIADAVAAATEALEKHRAGLASDLAERDGPMPDLLWPNVQSFDVNGDEVEFVSYSGYDRRIFPRWVFVLFARLDGKTPWREALAAAQAELSDARPGVDEALVRDLWRFGLLDVPFERDWKPGWEMADAFGVISSDSGDDPATGPTLAWLT